MIKFNIEVVVAAAVILGTLAGIGILAWIVAWGWLIITLIMGHSV